MGFSVSPTVLVKETSLSNTITAVSTSIGAIAGDFSWGPANEIVNINSERELALTFGLPQSTDYKDWFSAANFLAYSSALRVVRASSASSLNSSCGPTGVAGTGLYIGNKTDWESATTTDFLYARYFGGKGNGLRVVIADSSNYDTRTFSLQNKGITSDTVSLKDYFDVLSADADELYIIVIDNDQRFDTDSVVERMIVSKTVGARNDNNELYFIDDYVASYSNYIWSDYSNADVVTDSSPADGTPDLYNADLLFGGGQRGDTSNRQSAWDVYVANTQIDINLLITGGANTTDAKYALENVAEVRKDCVAFISPQQADIVGQGDETTMITNKDTAAYPASSYGFYDGNYKYQYSKYDDKYYWVPLNGDMAGLCARTDDSNDPWWSPAGLNRGHVKNVVKLAFQPSKDARDEMYKNNINPVLTFAGEGVVLYGDKTMQRKSDAFDRINVRRLFIVLEKAISTASKYMLFEFNDATTQAIFVNQVEPFLRRVQGRRGIYDFQVVADSTVNTGEVIANNEFVANILIKPAKSINVITLNFVAARNDVDFNEINGSI